MAQYTYDEPTNREDLTDVITNISPKETPITTMIGKTKAKPITSSPRTSWRMRPRTRTLRARRIRLQPPLPVPAKATTRRL